MEEIDRRSTLSLGLAAAAVPLFAWASPAGAESAPNYGPNDGVELSPGRRMVEIGMADCEIAAYKGIKVIDVIYQPGAGDPKEELMDMDMVCHITAGEFTIKKIGKPLFTVKQGDIYTCGKGRTDQAVNISKVVGVHRIALLMPA
jgi:hypothetical protein